ncbi:aspartyl/glutamyl-tRNA amidotransferase subunit C [Candidatus Gracilibacteria bacterium]|jgi:aspartyl/glutamyl-tRNA(Asn/Gln) amidotransferase C subunit|nr:aspartyl/glutamyl-tRNA amidotransferase subunit C [Candidatus Gracilibacteria bacterium]
MSISQDELKKIAEKLSKIPGDNDKLLGNITDIISYMDLLSQVDTDGVIPTVSVVDNIASLREDTISNPTEVNSGELLACSKQKVVANQIVLPNIMS